MMQNIVVDAASAAKLGELTGQVLITNGQGVALGFFSPLRGRPRAEDLQLDPPSSMERLEELRKNKTGKPLEEILKRHGL